LAAGHTITNEAFAPQVPREVAALLAALQFKDANVSGLQNLSDAEWRSLLRFSELAHLTLPLAQLQFEGKPAWVEERLQSNLADNALRFVRVKATYREAACALYRAGVDHVVIKGFTQAPDYVSNPRLRMQSDIDLFCPPDHIPRAQAALEALGYQPDLRQDYRRADHTPTMSRPQGWTWRGNAFDPDMPLSIELHFCLWNESTALFPVPETAEFWERRIVRSIDDVEFLSLHPVDHLGHLCLHILRNILARDTIVHHIYELATFLHAHAHDDAFWQSWTTLHSSSLRAKEAVALHHAHLWFRCDLHPAVQQQFEALPPQQASWLQRFGASACEAMFRENKDSLWLHLSLINHPGKKLLLLRRAFLPNSIPEPGTPAVTLAARAADTQDKPNPGHTRHLVQRTITYTRTTLSTLSRGLHWRLQQHQLAPRFWIFLAASFFFDLGLSIYFFLFNLFLIGHGYNEKSLGLLASAMAAGGFTGALPAGRLARRFGLRTALLTAFLLAIAIFATRALLLALPAQLVLAFLAGITLSIWAVCISPAVAQMTTERQRPFAFSLVFSLGIGVGALGGLFGGRLPGWLAHHTPFTADPLRLVLLLSCALVALGLWPVSRLRFDRPDLHTQALPTRARPALLSPFLLRFLPAIALWSLVTGSFSPFANVYFAHHMQMSLPQIGNAFSLSQIAQVAAVLLAPLLFRRFGLVTGIVFTQLSAATLLCILASIHSPLAATIGYMAFTAFQWMNEPGLFSLLMDRVPPDQREGAAASNSLVTSASQALAAMLAGAAFARFGYPAPMISIAVIATLAAALFWYLVGSRQPHTALELDRVAD
jgi:predicted MFS family arabinose efflux permease